MNFSLRYADSALPSWLQYVALLTLVAGVSQAKADSFIKDTLGATTSLRAAYWSDDKRFTSDQNFLVGSAWLTLRPQEVAGFRFYFDGYLQGEDLTRDTFGKGDAREFFVERSVGAFDFKVGRQIIVWGRADKLNPTDNLSVRDYRRVMTDDEDQRTGITSAQITYNVDTYRLKGIWLPEWRSPGFPLPKISPDVNWGTRAPTDQQALEQFAVKLDQEGGGPVDWSVSYFHGFGKTPNIAAIPKLPSGFDLELSFPRFDTVGFDFATTYGDWGLRGETAYTHTNDAAGNNPLTLNPFLFTVLGVERAFSEHWNFSLQYINRYTQSFSDPKLIADANTQQLAVQGAITANQLVRMNHGFSFRPAYKGLNETLEVETAFIHWFNTGDSLVRPKLTYAWSDQVKLMAGAEVYRGPVLSFFGRLKEASAVFLETRISL